MAKVPDGRSLVESYKDRPFVLVGVNTDAPSEELAELTRNRRIPWRSFADGGTKGPITQAWGVTAFPTTYLIDHTGVVRGVDLEGEELRARIDELLIEAEKGF